MSREKELQDLTGNDKLLNPLIKDMVSLEEELTYLRGLPKIKVHPNDPTKQKATPAAKLYKECLQQYTNIVRMLMRATGADVEDEESPLRRWFNDHVDS